MYYLEDNKALFRSKSLDCDPANFYLLVSRYFLRKLRKVKKANGQILAANEV